MVRMPNVESTPRPIITKMRLVVVALLLAGALYVRFAPTRRIPDHFNTPDELKIVWSTPVRSQAIFTRFSADGKYLISSGGELQGKISRYKNGEYLFDFKVSDKRLRLWSVTQKKQIEKLKAEAIFGGWNGEHMLIMPDFRTLITGGQYNDLKVIDVRKKRPDKSIWADSGTVTSLEVSPDEKTLAIGTIGGVEFFDARTLRHMKTYEHYGGNFGANVYFSQDSRTVKCMWYGSRNPHYVNVKTGKRIPESRAAKYFKVFRPPDGEPVIETNGNQIELWTWRKNKKIKLRTWDCDLVQIQSIELSPNKKVAAVGGLSRKTSPVRFYDVPVIN
jgi:WD40 repeat protein